MKKGFTLIEILTVILLIGIIATIVTVNYNRYLQASSLSAYKDSMLALIDQLEDYTLSNPSEYDAKVREQSNNPEYQSECLDCVDIDMKKLQLSNKATILSGQYRIDDNYIILKDVTNGKYCANGNKNNINITDGDCTKKE